MNRCTWHCPIIIVLTPDKDLTRHFNCSIFFIQSLSLSMKKRKQVIITAKTTIILQYSAHRPNTDLACHSKSVLQSNKWKFIAKSTKNLLLIVFRIIRRENCSCNWQFFFKIQRQWLSECVLLRGSKFL